VGVDGLPAAIVLGDGSEDGIDGLRGRERAVPDSPGELTGEQGMLVLRNEQQIIFVSPTDHADKVSSNMAWVMVVNERSACDADPDRRKFAHFLPNGAGNARMGGLNTLSDIAGMQCGLHNGLFMSYRIFPLAVVLLVGACLTGCQSDPGQSADALPPLRLSAPVVMAPAPAPRPAYYSAAPTAPPINPFHSSRPWQHSSAPSNVPAGWIPPVPANHWTWIIIHHSDSDYGSAAIIDRWHRDRGFDELGYHFVIGNGTKSGDGQIEIGPRWTKQKWGAHDNALDNRYNLNGIGICLVGDFNKTHPTAAQKRSLVKLVVYLMRTYHIPASRVLGHGETKGTECPGRYMNVAQIRSEVQQIVAQGGDGPSTEWLAANQ